MSFILEFPVSILALYLALSLLFLAYMVHDRHPHCQLFIRSTLGVKPSEVILHNALDI